MNPVFDDIDVSALVERIGEHMLKALHLIAAAAITGIGLEALWR